MERPDEAIIVRGARSHNLKDIDVKIPRDQLTVITGPSGSGKSSLAFDTIYAEGQRRYIESLSVYARQYIDQLEKPEVESISGLSPTISIEQKTTSYNPRSTVGTVTEVYDYLRLLYSRISRPICWKCHKEIDSQSPQQIVDHILTSEEGAKISILAPIVKERKGEHRKELHLLQAQGFVRAQIDGETIELNDDINLDRNKRHSIDVYVDRLIIKGDRGQLAARVSESVEMALKLGTGQLIVKHHLKGGKTEDHLMSQEFACSKHGISFPVPEPRIFSFNSPSGACAKCNGLGFIQPPKRKKSARIKKKNPQVEMALSDSEILNEKKPCPKCNGDRLKPESLAFKIHGHNIADFTNVSVLELQGLFEKLELTDREKLIADKILKEITDRIQFLIDVGVGYLSLGRPSQSISGGESQRIRLATQIGSSLVGVIYVLDEPSIGLHQQDNEKLLKTLNRLRDQGNTVLVVEHDQDTMEQADHILDLGPGAGSLGGELVAEGSLKDITENKLSLTGRYLRGELKIDIPQVRRPIDPKKMIQIKGANLNNLNDVDAEFPLGTLTLITGLSGSGKSTLVIDTLYRSLLRKVYKIDTGEIKAKKIAGLEHVDKVVDIDQSPIGRTPRSNPATYTGIFSLIRNIFAQVPESQVRGYAPGRFAFNVKGGRCDACDGDGVKKIEMHFMPDVYVVCDVCRGKRYNRDTLEIRYKGKNIADVLDMTVADAYEFFDAIPSIKNKLRILNEVGLGYITLGQKATTLSGGEAQRIKLAKELSKRSTGKTVYILDEPSTGLHFDDIAKLIKMLQTLVDSGNTVIVIEHNLDMIKVADHIIDLGPEGGINGGEIIAAGTPEEVAKNPKSATGRFLKRYF